MTSISRPIISFSVDDGCLSDIRLATLLEKYDYRMTVYLPVEWQRLNYEKGYLPLKYDDVKNLITRGHELGSHSISHPLLTRIDIDRAEYEIVESKRILEDIFNTKITKFCPPRGYSSNVLDEVIGQHYEQCRLTRGQHLVHIHPDSGANGNKPWTEVLRQKISTDTDVECWGHSWELDKYDLWPELEGVLERL